MPNEGLWARPDLHRRLIELFKSLWSGEVKMEGYWIAGAYRTVGQFLHAPGVLIVGEYDRVNSVSVLVPPDSRVIPVFPGSCDHASIRPVVEGERIEVTGAEGPWWPQIESLVPGWETAVREQRMHAQALNENRDRDRRMRRESEVQRARASILALQEA